MTTRATSDRDAAGSDAEGFTLLEILLAMALTLVAMSIIFSTFATVSLAYRRGTELTESLNQGDYVVEQLASGLRSAFFPPAGGADGYGFILDDNGSGPHSADVITWVKSGSALLRYDSHLASELHRIEFTIDADDDGKRAAITRAWRPHLSEDSLLGIDPETWTVSRKITGFNCRVSTNLADRGWEWEDDWPDELTNRLPKAVAITLYLAPIEEDDESVAVERLIEIPVAPQSWSRRR